MIHADIQQKSLGLPPSVAPKPTKSTANSTGLKVPLKPPLPQTLLPQPQIVAGHHVQVSDSNEALRNSSGYTVMKPPGNVNRKCIITCDFVNSIIVFVFVFV